ncbi:low temperature requirement protein A [Dactylosporangium vinaceum]|uniref:Low temperature requirement protein A n=1 Tax=Dactylosporangium vinaceum TaxID=53362 RepID=A0ABV5M5X2_9ACTN|nr:low temperature requirement protein A [Dactylosporangium vinaceum]UAC01240.1 low temperature requirement protein A [Dactylosporangium vinaceum]
MADERERPAPLVRPPELRVEGERSASRLELFFDLAYLLVVAELATALAEDLTWPGAAAFAGLFTVTWWSWVTTTLYANRFDTNDVVYRLAKLGTAAAVVGMAASARDAVGGKAVTFALCYLGTRVLLLALYARAYRHVRDARATIRIYLAGVAAGAVLWAASVAVDGPARYALWAAGILAEAAAPLVATRFGGGVPLHVEHLPERFGLFVMLVLGESIMSIASGVHETDWRADAVAPAAIAFLAVAAAWWNYFDLGGAAGKRRLETDGDDQESWVPDAYIYGHLPLTLGLAVFAVGVEEYIVHPGDGAPWALHGGVGLFLAGTAAVVAGTAGTLRAAWPWPAAALPVVAAIGIVDGTTDALPAPAAIGLTGAVVVATVLAGIHRQRRGRLRTAET